MKSRGTKKSRRDWSAPVWFGCDFPTWFRMLRQNRFDIHLSRLHIVIFATFASIYQTWLALLQKLLLDRKVAATEIREPPLFILGHWRSGTTLLHEMLTLDDRYTSPLTCQCFSPHNFLLTERTAPLRKWMFPTQRPMDSMVVGPFYPQEEEWALCLLGQPSPYLKFAFPNRDVPLEYLDFDGLPPEAAESWKRAFYRFLQQVHYRRPKRLVLKNPPSTCRIKLILDLFPDAQFVHIVRDPYVVFLSTLHLYKSMYKKHGLQKPDYADLEEHVLATFNRVHERLEKERELVDPHRFYELRYEDLVRDPENQLKKLYEHLDLGGFEQVRPRLKQYLAEHAGYSTNTYTLTAEQRALVSERWADTIRRQGYEQSDVVRSRAPSQSA